MSNKVKVILAALAALILFVALDGPEYTRKALNPVGYWTDKRDKAQEMVGFYQNEMRSCRLEFEKLKRTRDITLKQAILAGSTPHEARDEFMADVEATRESCSMMRELLTMEQAELENATSELAKYH